MLIFRNCGLTHQVLDWILRSVGADSIEGGQEVRYDQAVQILFTAHCGGIQNWPRLLTVRLITSHYCIWNMHNIIINTFRQIVSQGNQGLKSQTSGIVQPDLLIQ